MQDHTDMKSLGTFAGQGQESSVCVFVFIFCIDNKKKKKPISLISPQTTAALKIS